jgi:hypothetical protein|tara:strand:- start:3459 stop:3695 length:237 start_codon:yes stop_codon:yes gene_type:complete
MKKFNSPLRMIEDKAHTHASKKNSVGIVGETHIWDGPLNQAGRPHGMGSSSGAKGMKLKLGGVPYAGGMPITQIAKKG